MYSRMVSINQLYQFPYALLEEENVFFYLSENLGLGLKIVCKSLQGAVFFTYNTDALLYEAVAISL
jgi:hypothetical protein